jgi:cyclopropane fatty-acyl-phospholipid synthase-like methyltransferase
MLRITGSEQALNNLVLADISGVLPSSLRSSSIDLITAIHVFQHLDPKQLKSAMDNIYRLLAPGRAFIFIVGHPARDLLTADAHKLKQPKTWRQRATPWGTFIPHFYRATAQEYVEAATTTGFQIVTAHVLTPIPEGQNNAPMFRAHTELSSRLLVHAVKPKCYSLK